MGNVSKALLRRNFYYHQTPTLPRSLYTEAALHGLLMLHWPKAEYSGLPDHQLRAPETHSPAWIQFQWGHGMSHGAFQPHTCTYWRLSLHIKGHTQGGPLRPWRGPSSGHLFVCLQPLVQQCNCEHMEGWPPMTSSPIQILHLIHTQYNENEEIVASFTRRVLY